MLPPLPLALLYASPVLAQLARLAGLPTPIDRLLGAFILVAQVAGLAVAARRMARGLAAPGDALGAALAAVTIFLATPATIVAWLGACGLARPLPVLVAVAAASFALHAAATAPAPAGEADAPAPLTRFERGTVALGALAVAHMLVDRLREATRDADSVWYHLTTAAEIVRTGSIRPNPILTDHAIAYPAAREAIVAWVEMPLRSENLALLFPLSIAASALALLALARSFGLARPAALGAVVLLVTCPVMATAAVEQKNDLFLALAFLLAWHFLREAARSGLRRHAVLAGLAGGLLAGTKLTGVLLLGVLLLTWLVADLLAPGGPALARRRLGLLGVALATAGGVAGVWYARNLVLFHNPLYPKEIALLGHTVFPGLARLDKQFTQTVLGLRPARILEFRSQFVAGLGPAVALAIVLPLVAPLSALRQSTRFRAGAWIWLGALPALLFALYAILPYSVHPRGTSYWYVQPRFLIPFFATVCLGLGALVPDRGKARTVGLAALVALAAGGAALWMPPRSLVVVLALAFAAALLPAPRLGAAIPRIPRAVALAALLPAALGALGLDAFRERVKNDPVHGYRADPVEGWGDVCLWVRAHVAHAKILYTGTIQMYPLYGPGLTNTLFWVKTDPRQDDVEALYQAAVEDGVDYIVSFSPVKLRYGKRGERFDYGPSPIRALEARHPGSVEIVFSSGHADVARVLTPRPASI